MNTDRGATRPLVGRKVKVRTQFVSLGADFRKNHVGTIVDCIDEPDSTPLYLVEMSKPIRQAGRRREIAPVFGHDGNSAGTARTEHGHGWWLQYHEIAQNCELID